MSRKSVFAALTAFAFTVAASQCFAQSPSKTAGKGQPTERQYAEIINSLFYYIQQNYVDEVDAEKLYEGALKGMLGSLEDPYSVYMDKSEWRSLSDTTVGNFGGVGLQITKPLESTPEKPAYVEVAQPIDNSPGALAGIHAGDFIIRIDGVDTADITMDEVLNMLRGTVGESVTVTVRRGKTLEFDRTLVRAVIENPTVKYGFIDDISIGYVQISSFSANTASRVQEALDSFKKSKFTGLIIDLRNNGGGLLSSAVDIADKFIDDGPIVSTKSRISYENTVYSATRKNTTVRGVPVVVLINRASASASEILAGALKDSKTAYLVGEKTYGKGSVQVPSALLLNDGFKITVARYYTPSDTNIDKIGIAPDRAVNFPDFTPEEEKAFADLLSSGEIEKYVEAHSEMSDNDIRTFADELVKSYRLDGRVVRKLIRNEVDRTRPSRLYDIDYDLQLQEAVRILKDENFAELLAGARTVAELQAESSGAAEK